jgi:hypothetical protein
MEILYENKNEKSFEILVNRNGFIHYKIDFSLEEESISENIIEIYNRMKKIDDEPSEFLFKFILDHSEILNYKIAIFTFTKLEIYDLLSSFVFVINKIQKSNFQIKNDNKLIIEKEGKLLYSTNIPIKTSLI